MTAVTWALYAPFVVKRLAAKYGYSEEQARAHVQERTATAEHALSAILAETVEIPSHIRAMIDRARPETKAACGAAVVILGLLGLLAWLLKKK